jgi:hypothetical protein
MIESLRRVMVQLVAAVESTRQEHLFWSKLLNRDSTASVSTANWHWSSSNSACEDTPYLNARLAANHPPLFANGFVSRTAGPFELFVELCFVLSLFGSLRGPFVGAFTAGGDSHQVVHTVRSRSTANQWPTCCESPSDLIESNGTLLDGHMLASLRPIAYQDGSQGPVTPTETFRFGEAERIVIFVGVGRHPLPHV